jgi:transcriptional regulator with XRE-family HTH domain
VIDSSGFGTRLRAARIAAGMSLAEVSAASGLSISFLSHVETGKSDITISKLIRLLDVYKVPLGDILPDSAAEDPVVLRAGEQPKFASPIEGIDMYLLGPTTSSHMTPLFVTYSPGGRSAEYGRHPGEEFIYVIDGSIRLEIEGRDPVILNPGDSAYYRGDQKHAHFNVGGTNASLCAVVSPPHGGPSVEVGQIASEG